MKENNVTHLLRRHQIRDLDVDLASGTFRDEIHFLSPDQANRHVVAATYQVDRDTVG